MINIGAQKQKQKRFTWWYNSETSYVKTENILLLLLLLLLLYIWIQINGPD